MSCAVSNFSLHGDSLSWPTFSRCYYHTISGPKREKDSERENGQRDRERKEWSKIEREGEGELLGRQTDPSKQ